ncbi:MAG TPA: TadE/TadG family type IV pilus assembly protein [Stellaceae bacterium]|nr:TadE/TadG family type IV pilus assembly protein [Stellaceae bacterium]
MVEFSLLAPILLTLVIGSYETANYVLADLKLQAAAETAADLVAQTPVIDSSGNANYLRSADFTNITNAADQVMSPFATGSGQLKIAYASIVYDSSQNKVSLDWSVVVNGATAINPASLPNGAVASNLISTTSGSTDSVIVVQLTYTYTSPISYVLNSSYTITETAFNRPRYMNCIPTYLNTGNTCP